jgi:hypothetical protein
MGDIATYVTFVAEYIAALPRIAAWWALFCALIIELSGRSGWVLAVARLLLILAALTIAVLPATVYDPIAWVTLLWAIVPGFLIGWSRSRCGAGEGRWRFARSLRSLSSISPSYRFETSRL